MFCMPYVPASNDRILLQVKKSCRKLLWRKDPSGSVRPLLLRWISSRLGKESHKWFKVGQSNLFPCNTSFLNSLWDLCGERSEMLLELPVSKLFDKLRNCKPGNMFRRMYISDQSDKRLSVRSNSVMWRSLLRLMIPLWPLKQNLDEYLDRLEN